MVFFESPVKKSIVVSNFAGDKSINPIFQILFCHEVTDFGYIFKVIKHFVISLT